MKCQDCLHFHQAREKISFACNHIAFKCPATGKYSMDKWVATYSCLDLAPVRAGGGPGKGDLSRRG